jgi:hypothetical protein
MVGAVQCNVAQAVAQAALAPRHAEVGVPERIGPVLQQKRVRDLFMRLLDEKKKKNRTERFKKKKTQNQLHFLNRNRQKRKLNSHTKPNKPEQKNKQANKHGSNKQVNKRINSRKKKYRQNLYNNKQLSRRRIRYSA